MTPEHAELVEFMSKRHVNRRGEFERRATEAAAAIRSLSEEVATLAAYGVEQGRVLSEVTARATALSEEKEMLREALREIADNGVWSPAAHAHAALGEKP